MQWRMSFISFVVAPMVVAAACSDAALLEPKDNDGDGTGAQAGTGTGGGTSAGGGKAGTGGRPPGAGGGKVGGGPSAGGGPWSAGGGPASGGFGNTGGAAPCFKDIPHPEHCAMYPGLCAPLTSQWSSCLGRGPDPLVQVSTGCGLVFMEYRLGAVDSYGATYSVSTGQAVQVITNYGSSGCSMQSGARVACNTWQRTTCERVFGDGGVVRPQPPDPTPDRDASTRD